MKQCEKGDVWLVSPSGSLPEDGWRPHRFNYLAKNLMERGFRVRWWMPTFSHDSKKHRYPKGCTIKRGESLSIRFLSCGEYKKHIGLARVVFLIRFALGFLLRSINSTRRPKLVIVVTPSLGSEVAGYLVAKRFGAKLIIDIIDIWPEFFLAFVPHKLKAPASVILSPVRLLRDWVGTRADGVISCCQSYLNLPEMKAREGQQRACIYWGGEAGGRLTESQSRVEIEKLIGRQKREFETWVVYGGTLGNNYDIFTILDCAKSFLKSLSTITFVIAGGGPLEKAVADRIKNESLTNVMFLGRIPNSDLLNLYQVCDVGVSSYIGATTVAMPIKFYDYVASGLPVVNSINGELADLIQDRGVGKQFEAGSFISLAQALKGMESSSEERNTMAVNCKVLAADFRPQELYSKYGDIVETIGRSVD